MIGSEDWKTIDDVRMNMKNLSTILLFSPNQAPALHRNEA